MGSFYTNITLRTTKQSSVVDALRSARRDAFVSEPVSGCTVVFDSECEDQDIEVLKSLASLLSSELRCPALSVLIHDDDVLIYVLHENGKLVDEYNSAPEYFNTADAGAPEGGNAQVLCRAFGAHGSVGKVDAALRVSRSDEAFVFETERHEELVNALGLPAIAVSTGYNYIEQGELPEGADDSLFVRI
jgi:hypothetical protein